MSGPGFGQIDPAIDGSSDLTTIIAVVRQIVERLDVMKLVKVVAVHPGQGTPPAGGTVDVLPLVNQIDGNGNPVPHGTVNGLQVWRMQAGPWAVIADPAVGDFGYVLCADRDSSLVVKNQGQANPGSRRRYNIADGIYVGGVAAMNGNPSSYLWLKSDGSWNLTDKFGNVLTGNSSGFAVTPAGGTMTVNGALNVTGEVTAQSGTGSLVKLSLHTHSGVTVGSGASGPPTPGS